MDTITISGSVSEWQASLETMLWAGTGLGFFAGIIAAVLVGAVLGLVRQWQEIRQTAREAEGVE
ncbi:hypothetical protein [Methylocaldum sp.]|uniref:hypothetical protein n=1 Tax=Methylocaldum sp. TaxID=1969727 RepID=UPI002D4A983C|nr:hypothetical protein [Methylocaldum sp.]HYE34936.1 hypothetical protein [Methylocaldum sp.]